MTTIGQMVQASRAAAGLDSEKYAKQLGLSLQMLNQIEKDRPWVISAATVEKLAANGIQVPQNLLDQHNFVAAACRKASKYSQEFQKKALKKYPGTALPLAPQVAADAVPAPDFQPMVIRPELQAAVDAVDKELAEHGTVGGVPVDTSRMVKGRRKAKQKTARPAQPKTVQGTLPGFLEQMGKVSIDEMITQYLYQRLQERIDARLDEIFGARKQG